MGFGSTGKKRKGPCTKQCAWRKHGSSDTRLAEACPPKLRNTVKYRVEEMRPKWPFWKHRAPKMRLVEAQCAYRKHCYPETPLGGHPTSGVSQNIFELFSDYRFHDFDFFELIFRTLADTYCICVSCVTLPGWDPCPCRILFIAVAHFDFFSELIG